MTLTIGLGILPKLVEGVFTQGNGNPPNPKFKFFQDYCVPVEPQTPLQSEKPTEKRHLVLYNAASVSKDSSWLNSGLTLQKKFNS